MNISSRQIVWLLSAFIVSVVLAISIPRLGLFISLFGALCLSVLGIAFPAIIEICVLWPENDFGPCKFMLIKNILLIVFGLLGLVVGTYVSIVDIVKSFEWTPSSIAWIAPIFHNFERHKDVWSAACNLDEDGRSSQA